MHTEIAHKAREDEALASLNLALAATTGSHFAERR